MGKYVKYITTKSNYRLPIPLNSIWDFPSINKNFGDSHYPGRIPGEVYLNFFYYFTKENDTILDFFCGSGTGIDVGNDFNRNVIGLDINPYRDDIIKFNLLKDPNPFKEKSFRHFFFDPPYFDMKKGEYSSHRDNLANLSHSEFIDSLELILRKFLPSLANYGFVALIISNKREKGKLIDLESETREIFSRFLTLKHKIIVPYHNTRDQGDKRAQFWAKKRFLLIGHRTLFIFQKMKIITP